MSKVDWPPPRIPRIPFEVKVAASEGNLVIFVGAGVSRLMGCPSWGEFADGALRQLADQELITFADVEQLSNLSAKQRLSIAVQVSKSKSVPLNYEKLIMPSNKINSKVYEHLLDIGCIYVTTNYDRFLDSKPGKMSIGEPGKAEDSVDKDEPEIIYQPKHLRISQLRRAGTVIHLHGSINYPESLIMTTPQYLEFYDKEQVRDFLKEMFDHYTILFLGYGLEEWEVLEHILRKGGQPAPQQQKRFMLVAFFSHQKETFLHLNDYYVNSFGVRLIHYSLDHMSYRQLEKIMEDWAGELEVGRPLLADDLKYVLKVADE